jgi:hypothetical protein
LKLVLINLDSFVFQPPVHRIIPYLFFVTPFFVIAYILIANHRFNIPTSARKLTDKSFNLSEMSATAFNAIQSAVEKYDGWRF